MKLSALIAGLNDAALESEEGEAHVTGFAIDHRKIAPGNIFGAFQGTKVNGEDFIEDAVSAGALAIVAHPDAQVEGAVHIAAEEPRRVFCIDCGPLLYPDTAICCSGHRDERQDIYCRNDPSAMAYGRFEQRVDRHVGGDDS